MSGTFQMNLMKVMAQADPHRQLAYAVQRTTDEVNRLVANCHMERINKGLEDGDIEVVWQSKTDLFIYYDLWNENKTERCTK